MSQGTLMPGMMQDDGLKCPRCQSKKICKNGHKNGKQRFLCKDCRRQFVGLKAKPGYDLAFKQICLKAYLNGKSFREIERTYGVHHTTAISWVQEAGFDLSEMARWNAARSHTAPEMDGNKVQNDEVKKAVLAGALQTFAKQGYALTSLSEVSRTAGVSTQTLKHYFKDKETLFSAIIQQLLNEAQQHLAGISTGISTGASTGDERSATPEAVLRRVAIALLSAFSKDQTLSVLIRLLIGESSRFPELAKRFVSEIERPIFDQLSTYLKFHPDVQIDDPLAATRMFVASLMHYWLVQNVLQAQDPLAQERDRMVDGLVASIMGTVR